MYVLIFVCVIQGMFNTIVYIRQSNFHAITKILGSVQRALYSKSSILNSQLFNILQKVLL